MAVFHLPHVTVGADPELWVAKHGTIVSGHTLKLGTKDHPQKTANGSVQVDGMALEVNVAPSDTKMAFIRNCSAVIQDLEKLVKAADPEMYLVCQPSAKFPEKYMKKIPETAKELGCNPDWNAYEMAENPRPKLDGELANLRTAGGHVHIGWGSGYNPTDLGHIALCAEVAKQLDYTIGLPSLDFDKDNDRRQLYGQAGAFRPKPYGMEYRVLSPLWLLSITTVSMVWNGVFKALRMLNEGKALDEQFEGLARDYINNSESDWRTITPALEKAIA